MNGNEVALDTNQAIAVLNNRGGAGAWIAAFARVHLPALVVGELRFGALNSKRPDENLRSVDQLVARCGVIDVTAPTAEVYARVRLSLKRAGTPIPENDVWIAATCVEHSLALATSDEHFLQVQGLRVIRR